MQTSGERGQLDAFGDSAYIILQPSIPGILSWIQILFVPKPTCHWVFGKLIVLGERESKSELKGSHDIDEEEDGFRETSEQQTPADWF